jgi:hypothetical protein
MYAPGYTTVPQLTLFKRLVDATDGMAAALDDPDILCTLFARTYVHDGRLELHQHVYE